MKNLLVFGLVAVCAVLMSSESVFAGGGKKKSRGSIEVTNQQNQSVSVYVYDKSQPFPTTFGQVRDDLKTLAPGETATFDKLKNGTYAVYFANATDLAGIDDDTPVTESDFNAVTYDEQDVTVNGKKETLITGLNP